MRRAIRVLILSDTHGFLDPRVAEEAASSAISVHAGDVGNGAVLATLRARTPRLIVVRGNNDTPAKWAPQDHDLLQSLPWEAKLDLPGGYLIVVHGHRAGRPAKRHAWLRKHYAGARGIVNGHSHHQCADRNGEPWVLNPGAAGRARTYGGPSCMVLYASPRAWKLDVKRFAKLSK